jgi:hypothetical protein
MDDTTRRALVIDLTAADIVIKAGVLDGRRGFTLVRHGHRLISKPPSGPNDLHLCARCDDTAVLLSYERDRTWEYLCREHGYAGTWMTWAEFRARLDRYKAEGKPGGAILAFVMWGLKRIRD